MCLSDVARVLVHDQDTRDAIVDIGGRRLRVSTLTLGLDAPPPEPGDWLLVHTGFAVERLTNAEAASILQARTDPVSNRQTMERPSP